MAPTGSTLLLLGFPDEIALSILWYLDIPDLYALTKTSRHLRTLATDPLLHAHRLQQARFSLSLSLSHRRSLDSLRASHIWVSPREATLRTLSRNLLICRLKRRLAVRPDVPTLIERGVLPAPPGHISTVLVSRVEQLEKERVKDAVRRWVACAARPRLEEAEREGWVDLGGWDGGGDGHDRAGRRPRVRELAKRYRCRTEGRRGEVRWGSARKVRVDPPRAKVLGLRRFYEKLSRAANLA